MVSIKYIFTLLLILVVSALGNDLKEMVDKEAPDFTLKTFDGKKTVTLKDLRGKVVIVDFWASWCAPCKKSLPELDQLDAALEDVVILAINIDDKSENALEFIDELGLNLTCLFDKDKKVVEAYGVSAMPSALLIDKKGMVRYAYSGYTKEHLDVVKKHIKALL